MSKRVAEAQALDFVDEWIKETFVRRVPNDAKDMHTYCMMLKYDVYDLIRDIARKFGCEIEDIFTYSITEMTKAGKLALVDAGYVEVTTIGVYDEPGKFGYRFYRPFRYHD